MRWHNDGYQLRLPFLKSVNILPLLIEIEENNSLRSKRKREGEGGGGGRRKEEGAPPVPFALAT